MVRFIIGLGNPGEKYEKTPHNLGRVLVEGLAASEKSPWKKAGSFSKTESEPAFVILNTFMNASGEAVRELLKYSNCPPEEILVCYDDFDLPFGAIRIRQKGSPGTHKGLKSVTDHLQTQNFPRLRLGIGPIPPGAAPDQFVLSPLAKSKIKTAEAMLDRASQAIDMIIKEGLDKAMNQFNAKSEV